MYRVNEIFFSLQGEGYWTGTPMVFVRLSGCNLQCPFCDTDHSGFREMSAEDIVREVIRADAEVNRDNPWWKDCGRVCITGGEPLLQLGCDLINALHRADYQIHLETNGTRPVPEMIDWVCMSPKEDVPSLVGKPDVVLERVDELKLVFDGTIPEERLEYWSNFPARWHFLQPCDTGNPEKNRLLLEQTISYVKQRGPIWRLSLQTHKLLHIR